MGTKTNPGPFDCYANAKSDEPMFVLLARDPLAPFFVTLWAAIKEGNDMLARDVCDYLESYRRGYKALKYRNEAKIKEAHDCATAMRNWKTQHPEV